MKNTRNQKGITLVALIITIIVLLILAIVAISAVSGDDIIGHANDAVTKTSLAQAKEQAQIYLSEWKIQSKIPGNTQSFEAFMKAKLGEDNVTNNDGVYTLSINGQTVSATENGVISQLENPVPEGGNGTGGTEPDDTGSGTLSSYTDEASYKTYAEGLGYTVLTMDEYNSSYAPDWSTNTYHPGNFSYTKIALPYGVTGEDGSQKFMYNNTITDVLIPNTMTRIGDFMFSNCSELKCVYISGSIKVIGDYAFQGCGKLDTVIFEDTFSGCSFGDSVLYETPWHSTNCIEYNEEKYGYEVIINGETYYLSAECFIEGTKILTPSGLVNIETVKVGDKIISKNNETGKIEEKEVLKVAKHEIKYNTLKIYVADTEIEVTPNHRIYVKGVGYTEAGKLKVGDILVNINNVEMPIEKIEEVENTGIKRVYNFVVEDNHNYFVGIDSILVHNKCFVAGSKVLTTKGLVNIENVKVGDYVITYNQETGMNEVHKVTETFIHEKVQDQVTISFSDESKVIMNMYHPLYTEEGWKSLSNFNGYETLEVGDKVKIEEGYKEVSKIEVDLSNSPVDMYTINVEDADNFYVNGTLAHDNEY